MFVKLHIDADHCDINDQVIDILKRKLLEKSVVQFNKNADHTIYLYIDNKMSNEGYKITADHDDYTITGGSTIGLLFGIGKFIRCCKPGYEFEYNGWIGESYPNMPYRIVYFPMHFYNYYHSAPIDVVLRYLEDIILMGYNAIEMWYDMHHFSAIDDPESITMLSRMKAIYKKSDSLGMKNILLGLSNEAFANSPQSMRARSSGGHDGYISNLMGHYHVELCPNKPGAMDLILKWRKQVLQRFVDCNIKIYNTGAYDQGGCTCSQCKPWGVNGNILIVKKIAKLVKDIFPESKMLFSTWRFDLFTSGEWEKLAEILIEKQDYADLLCSEIQEPGVYKHFTTHGIPGELPVIGFPEISMIGAVPWGGFGTNPHPSVIQTHWNTAKQFVSGGAPYSEGIYEDINKFVCAQMYWTKERDCWDMVREYVRSEFSSNQNITDDIMSLVHMFEESLYRHRIDERGGVHDYPDDNIPRYGIQRFIITNSWNVESAYKLMCQIDERLSEKIKRSWRWRLFYIRAAIDYELKRNDYICNSITDSYMEELTMMYYAQNSDYACAPPTRKVIMTKSTGTTFITFDTEEEWEH
ncbi:MAG: hypothetical protein SCM11_02920 [Bacillota bacterium]|nr:hypothetical protein [Bacillota bacterium]